MGSQGQHHDQAPDEAPERYKEAPCEGEGGRIGVGDPEPHARPQQEADPDEHPLTRAKGPRSWDRALGLVGHGAFRGFVEDLRGRRRTACATLPPYHSVPAESPSTGKSTTRASTVS